MSNNKLPHKENGIFKKIVRSYECKQYKNGLKFSKQILSNPKFSEHGETHAMKGLILNSMGRKEEAYEHVRKGLKNDLRSHVCWHVYGLLQRSDKKYEEAIKCYRNALKWDTENVQILRDMSLLQVQMRDLEGFRDTRYQLLKLRPAQRGSWVGYAVAYHMLKDYDMAIRVMGEYRKTQTVSQEKPDYEYSEMIMYEGQLLRESGQLRNALKFLGENEPHICDILGLYEMKADIFSKQKNFSEACKLYWKLLKRNPENTDYYQALEDVLKPTDLMQFYINLQKEFPRTNAPKRLPLNFTTGDTFARLLDEYLQPALHKGIPPLFVSVKGLYKDPAKVQVITETVESYYKCLREYGTFYPPADEETPAVQEPPSTELWVLFFLSRHYTIIGDTQKAMEYVEKAIEHTPTMMELYMLKAKVYKNAGDEVSASYWMDEAQSMDTADRYVNSKCAKYLLRVDSVDEAVEKCQKFTRDGGDTMDSLIDMQCMWFELECAHSYYRLGKLGEALKKCHQVEKHFQDIGDDQFDFHIYCMRKMTLRAYVNFVSLEDSVKSHYFYVETTKLAVKIYLHLHDNPEAKVLDDRIKEDARISSAELKKIRQKQRKADLKAQAKAQDDKKENKAENEKKTVEEKENDFEPVKLLSVKDPLQEAAKFLTPLKILGRGCIDTYLMTYSIYSRKRKFLLMLQSLKRSLAIDTENPQTHANIVDFVLSVQAASTEELSGAVKAIVEEALPVLLKGFPTADNFNGDFISRHHDSLPHLISGATAMYRLHQDLQSKAIELVTDLGHPLISLQTCLQVHSLLTKGTLGDCPQQLAEFVSKCHSLFPMATAFKPPTEKRPCQDNEEKPTITETTPVGDNLNPENGGTP